MVLAYFHLGLPHLICNCEREDAVCAIFVYGAQNTFLCLLCVLGMVLVPCCSTIDCRISTYWALWRLWECVRQTNYRVCNWPKGFSSHALKSIAEFPWRCPAHDWVSEGSKAGQILGDVQLLPGRGWLQDFPKALQNFTSTAQHSRMLPTPPSLSASLKVRLASWSAHAPRLSPNFSHRCFPRIKFLHV